MKLILRILFVLMLAAWTASLAQADARQRNAKNAANAARHAILQHMGGGAAKGRGTAARGGPRQSRFHEKGRRQRRNPPAGVSPPAVGLGTSPGANPVGADAIGARLGTVAIPRGAAGAAKIGPGATAVTGVHPVPPALLAHGGGISGTGMARPGAAPGMVGGPARVAGAISGTGMRSKR